MQPDSIIPPECPEGACLIPLTKGRFAIVDAEDYERVSQFKWYFTGKYAMRGIRKGGGYYKNVMMHRFIVDAPDNREVDHKNHNQLDNRKVNLRLCTHLQNGRNKLKPAGSAGSRFIGVQPRKASWRALIFRDGKPHHLGTYDIEEDAARAYDAAAWAKGGEFANLNFPDAEPLSLADALSRARKPKHSSPLRGASWDKLAGKWTARIRAEGKYLFLGHFATDAEAAAAYQAAVKKYRS